MKNVLAILLLIGGGCVQADVYKWTDEKGEVHFSETAPASKSEKVMTNEQIKQTEESDQARPQQPAATDRSIDEEVQQRMSECQRFKNLRADYLLKLDKPALERIDSQAMGLGSPMISGNDGTANMPGYDEIEAGIRNNCQD